tara:strand:- start:4454 stop:4672 length:219 start_codon:yes stop_codon:yes gene_type:complete
MVVEILNQLVTFIKIFTDPIKTFIASIVPNFQGLVFLGLGILLGWYVINRVINRNIAIIIIGGITTIALLLI